MAEKLKKIFDQAIGIKVYGENVVLNYCPQSEEYKKLMLTFKKMIKYATTMPALAVAVDEYTHKYILDGRYAIEFTFSQKMLCEGMEFERLFVKISTNHSGLNLERFIENKYQGRCYYFNFDKTTTKLYELMVNLIKEKS